MKTRSPAPFLQAALTLAVASALSPLAAQANQAAEPPAPLEAAPAPAMPLYEGAPPAQARGVMVAPPAAYGRMTDHDEIVGHWGIEARQLTTLSRTDQGCGSDCAVPINAFGLRRWYSTTQAVNFGLAVGIGGGASRVNGVSQTWDTYFGFGPTGGMNFLLGKWKHLAVSASPQLDLLLFMPGGSKGKTIMANARGVIEGEFHLGFIGLPSVSVGATSGLELSTRFFTKADGAASPKETARVWSLSTTGPQSLWDLVTKMYIRFYL